MKAINSLSKQIKRWGGVFIYCTAYFVLYFLFTYNGDKLFVETV